MKTKHVVFLSIICVAFVSTVAGVVLLAARGASNKELSEKEPISRPVSVAIVRSHSDGNIRIFPGKVRGTNRAELAFSVSGLFNDLNIKEGQNAKRGEILGTTGSEGFLEQSQDGKSQIRSGEKACLQYSFITGSKG